MPEGADHSAAPIISHIPRHPVESTGIATVGYSRRLHALEIEFRDGSIYRYVEIPISHYHGLMRAESKAHYYNEHLRGKYRCMRVKARRRR
ncbi:MAG: KTSC domain-containing protein [Chthoniobacterales bacterium]